MNLNQTIEYLKQPCSDDLNYKILSKKEAQELYLYIKHLEHNLEVVLF